METNVWFRFAISVSAVWRLTHLLAAEDGPWDVIVRIRRKAGTTIGGRLMDCFKCLSLWISIPFAFYVADGMLSGVVTWLALSGAACLAERIGEGAQAPIVFEQHGFENSGFEKPGLEKQGERLWDAAVSNVKH